MTIEFFQEQAEGAEDAGDHIGSEVELRDAGAPDGTPVAAGTPPAHSRKIRDQLRPHRARLGNGREFYRRISSLFAMVLLVVVLGLLLAGIVVAMVVVGSFLLETLID